MLLDLKINISFQTVQLSSTEVESNRLAALDALISHANTHTQNRIQKKNKKQK